MSLNKLIKHPNENISKKSLELVDKWRSIQKMNRQNSSTSQTSISSPQSTTKSKEITESGILKTNSSDSIELLTTSEKQPNLDNFQPQSSEVNVTNNVTLVSITTEQKISTPLAKSSSNSSNMTKDSSTSLKRKQIDRKG